MASVQILINGSATPSLNITQSSTVTLTNGDNSGVASWSWEFIDVPPGSSASLSAPSASSTTFVADKEGSYLIGLTLNGTISGTISGTGLAAVLQIQTGLRLPAAIEQKEADMARGWATALNKSIGLFEGEIRTGSLLTAVSSGILSVGMPVRITGETSLSNGIKVPTVAQAFSDIQAHLPVSGVCITSAGSSGVQVKVRVSGALTEIVTNTVGATVGAPVFVDDSGALSVSPGTIACIVGSVQTVGVSGRVFITAPDVIDSLGTTATQIADSTSIPGTSLAVSRADHQHGHGNRSGGSLHALATDSIAGFLASTDKTKLDSWLNVKDFGAKGDNSANDTAAFLAAIAAATPDEFGPLGKKLYVPYGQYKITETLTVPGNLGFSMVGDGPYATTIQWHGPDGDDFLVVNSSQAVRLRDFTLNVPNGSNRVGKMIFFSYDPVVALSSGDSLDNVWIQADGADGVGKYDYGIYWSDAAGNNSEVTYREVRILNFALNGVTLPGSQQKNHVFYNCNIGGGWDGVTPGSGGGQYGVMAGQGVADPGVGGSFQWFGGGVSSCSLAAFGVFYGNDPLIIDGCQTEENYRFIDSNATGTANTSTSPRVVRGCRISYGIFNGADQSAVRICDLGPWSFTGNNFEAGFTAGQKAQIEVNTGAPALIDVTGNQFSYHDSVTYGPFNISGIYIPIGDLRNNTYVDASNQNDKLRCEPLNTAPLPAASVASCNNGEYWLSVDLSKYIASALSQGIAIQTVPRGAAIKRVNIYPGQIAPTLSGFPAITASIGFAAGASHLLQPIPCNATTEQLLGNNISNAGPSLQVAPLSGFVNDFLNDTTIYLTLTSASGNLGTGTVTNLTGQLFVILEIAPKSRWIVGA